MRIGGIVDISTKDIPNKSTMVIFTVGCNLQCEFCHNKALLNVNIGKEFEVQEIINKIEENILVNAISISGGEPLLQKDLIDLSDEIKKLGKYLSIDTNGTFPERIEELLPFVDRIALDIKSPLNSKRLKEITNTNADYSKIIKSINIINNQQNIDFEIRTTYVENLMNPDDIDTILSFLIENKFRGNFVLQQYQYSEGVGKEYKEKFQKPDHITLTNILSLYKRLNSPFKMYLRDDIVGYSNINELFE
jgi:pyruvate formate lyase activating enzyme